MRRTKIDAPWTILTGAALCAVGLVVAAMTIAPSEVRASAAIAAKTGQPCGKCHTAPPKLNAYGQSYKKKGG